MSRNLTDEERQKFIALYGTGTACKGCGDSGVTVKIWEKYGSTKAVLIIDMSGFSLLTQRHGIVHYLSMVRRMQITAEPIIESYGGQVIKFEADNCYAMFDDPLGAVQSAIALNHSFQSSNHTL